MPSRCRCQIAFNMCSEVECQVACCSHPHLELHDQPLFSVRMLDAWMFEAVVDASAAVPMLLLFKRCVGILHVDVGSLLND